MKSLILIALLSTQVLASNKTKDYSPQAKAIRSQASTIIKSNLTRLMAHQVSAKQCKEMKRNMVALIKASKQVAKAVK